MYADAWTAVLHVNLNGTFYVTQAAIPHLKRSPAGSVLVMSSLAGSFGYPNRSPYATSKWGLVGLTKTLSRELGAFGVRVNAILPGAVEGPRIERVLEGRAQVSGRSLAEARAAALAKSRKLGAARRFLEGRVRQYLSVLRGRFETNRCGSTAP